ncbi:hypothetical protein IQ260_04315 [Leptolyngbya cf. ectocarpi LEGE 11479]|uniref:Uncharacterized protein n=1 Tax=Leptolyngbya cf. ectocarpi LEGE 11479 TaxID=1828722 RepID=A0A928WYY1_LEPEC|nr:hypothetical protein [Leptolyngbya ectocarpi]MBE9065872.1 hypothetical protein [Leptolyngbya cf. ectocarpi LEGE 11479]
MPKTLFQGETANRLAKIWTNRYIPDLSQFLTINNALTDRRMIGEILSKKGRERTVQKLSRKNITEQCNLAAVRARQLYANDTAATFRPTSHLAKLLSRIYFQLLDIYQETTSISMSSDIQSKSPLGTSLPSWGIPEINTLATALSPLLSELQEWNRSFDNWKTVGFSTAQINLSNSLLLEQLTDLEQVFLRGYFQFLEEQVALPWQRMCSAAADYTPSSSLFLTVERLLPMTTNIAEVVHKRWSRSFPNYASRRGTLTSAAIRHSSVRDFEMFQIYLWLSCLEKNLTHIEQELSAICVIVYGALNIPWTMTVDGTTLLMHELLNRLEPHERGLVSPYAQAMIRMTNKALFD